MPEEASENLVKVFLENKDYLVTTNKKVRIKHKVKTKTKRGYQIHNSPCEVDIIAVNLKDGDKIIGEVKGWRSGVDKTNFKKLHKASNSLQKSGQRALRIINDQKYKRRLKKAIEKIYGANFRIVLFVDHIKKKDEPVIRRFMKKEKFDVTTFGEILTGLDKDIFKFSYSNEPLIQLLRIQKRLSKY